MFPCISLTRMDERSSCFNNVDSVWCCRFSSYFDNVTVYYQPVKRLERGASRVHVTSSDDSRVGRIACA